MKQIRTLTVTNGLIEQMVGHARADYPREACGLLVGQGELANRFLPLENAAAGDSEYAIEPQQLIDTFRQLRQSGEELVGIFHSHPRGPAEPSIRDIRDAYYPQVAYIVVSLADLENPVARAFRIIDGRSYPIELHAIV